MRIHVNLDAAASAPPTAYETPACGLGATRDDVDLDKALAVADALAVVEAAGTLPTVLTAAPGAPRRAVRS